MRLPARIRSLATAFVGRARLRVRGGPNRGLRWSAASSGRGYISGRFEEARLRRLVALSREGAVCWDVGAHKGYVTLALARASGASGRVVAVEPAPDNLVMLRRHMAWNRIGNVQVVEAAVGATDGVTRFGGGGSSISYRIGAGSLDVRMLSLPSLLREVGGPAADLLKLDVEGEEVRVLESAGAAISPHSAVCVAVHSPAHYRACAALLRSRGMRIAHSGPIEAWRSSGRWRGDPDLVGIGTDHPLFRSDLAALDLHPVPGH